MTEVKFSEQFQREISRRIGVRPDQVIETLNAPGKTDELDFHGSGLKIHTKLLDSTRPPCTLLVIESDRDGERAVNSAFRVYPELTANLHELRPLEVLRLLT